MGVGRGPFWNNHLMWGCNTGLEQSQRGVPRKRFSNPRRSPAFCSKKQRRDIEGAITLLGDHGGGTPTGGSICGGTMKYSEMDLLGHPNWG